LAERELIDYADSLHFLAGAFDEFKSKEGSKETIKEVDRSDVPNLQDVANLANTVNHHTCNAFCGGIDQKDKTGKVIKKGKFFRSDKNFEGKCKARFPKPHDKEETRVRYTVTTSRKTNKEVITVGIEVGRKHGDRNINAYHLLTLEIWRANIDAQLVVCIKSATRYVTKYVNKEEVSSAAFNQMESDFIRKVKQETLSRKAVTLVKSLLHNFVKARNIGAHELYMLIMYDALVYTDVKEVWVNINPDIEVTDAVKDKHKRELQFFPNRWNKAPRTPDMEVYKMRLSDQIKSQAYLDEIRPMSFFEFFKDFHIQG